MMVFAFPGGFGLAVMRQFGGRIQIHTLDEVDEIDVGLNIFPSGGHALGNVHPFLAGMRKALTDAGGHLVGDQFDEIINRAGFQRPIGANDLRTKIGPGRFQS